jgi:hypothetical protein
MRDSYGFTSPNQLGTGAAKAPPAAECVLGWGPLGPAIPPFHRLHRDPVANRELICNQYLPQWGMLFIEKFVITRNVQAQSTEMLLEARDSFQAANANDFHGAHLSVGLMQACSWTPLLPYTGFNEEREAEGHRQLRGEATC